MIYQQGEYNRIVLWQCSFGFPLRLQRIGNCGIFHLVWV